MRSSTLAVGLAVAGSLLFLGAVVASAQDAVPDSVTPERVLEGSDLFNSGSCGACHAVGGRGQGRNGPDLSDDAWLHGSDFDSIFHTIWWGVETDEMKAEPKFRFEMHPRGGMPWTRQQSKAVAAYVWSISRPQTHGLVALQAEFVAHATAGRADRAIETYERAGHDFAGHPLFSEGGLNSIGYRLLGAGDVDGAITLLDFNARLHPDSWNVWDSLGEAYAQKGDRARAIELYQKSVEMNPENENGKKKLAELRGRR
jgi:tetratricopeptide (TPR) repeat protein